MQLRTIVGIAAVAVACATVTPLTAQGRNVTLLGTLAPASRGADYTDIWGYTDPNTGKEYALLGSEDGTHVIDCSNPASPVQKALIPSDNPGGFGNTWRDIKTFGAYAYIVSESHGGMQIVDLSNPDSPVQLPTFGASLWGNAHNIGMDQELGLAYVCGTDTGTHVIDVASNPTSPTRIYQPSIPYIHDLSVHRGWGYFAEQNGNTLQIYDVAQLPGSMPLVGSGKMPGASVSHATWPSRDNQWCAAANETRGGPVSIWDVSNKRLPRLVATYNAGTASSIPHNVFVRDRVLHVSHYVEGYRVLDLTDPVNTLVEVGFYDTSTSTPGGYDGAWGVFHDLPSGNVLVSDMQNGLFVLKPKATAARYGVASAGSGGTEPVGYAFGAAYLGNTRFALEAEQAPPNSPGVLVIGSGRGSTVFGSLTINVSLANPVAFVNTASDSAGNARAAAPIPNISALSGIPLNAQMVFVDSLANGDLSGTQGLEFETFVR